jgi:hypothetical protein
MFFYAYIRLVGAINVGIQPGTLLLRDEKPFQPLNRIIEPTIYE